MLQFGELVGGSSAGNLLMDYKSEYRAHLKFIREEKVYGLPSSRTYLQKDARSGDIVLCFEETFMDSQSEQIVAMLEELLLVNSSAYFCHFIGFAFEEVAKD